MALRRGMGARPPTVSLRVATKRSQEAKRNLTVDSQTQKDMSYLFSIPLPKECTQQGPADQKIRGALLYRRFSPPR